MFCRFLVLMSLIIVANKSENDNFVACIESVDKMVGTCTTTSNYNAYDFKLTNKHKKSIITMLVFRNSTISNVPTNFTKGFHNLTSLDLSSCNIQHFSKKAFSYSAINLQSLNISRNNISELGDCQFRGANDLKELDLSHNVIRKIEEGAFTYLVKLKIINLSNNEIRSLVNATFEWSALESLNLNNNKLQTLHLTIHCRTLYLDNNLLISDNVSTAKMISLNYLSLRNNSLTHLQFLGNLPNLTQLVISNNQLDNVNFTELPESLEILDISNNNLKSIDFNSLSHLNKLKRLYMNGNPLGNQNFTGIKDACPYLNAVEIADNEWTCNRLNATVIIFNQLHIKARTGKSQTTFNESNINGIGYANESSSNVQNTNIDEDSIWFTILIKIISFLPIVILVTFWVITRCRENNGNQLQMNFERLSAGE